MSEWISVEDRLPCDPSKLYLVNVREYQTQDDMGDNLDEPIITNDVDMAEMKEWESEAEPAYSLVALAYDYGVHITHWMPLPEPPKE